MVKYVVYTCNLPFMPKTMEEVIDYAKTENKFRIAPVELNQNLSTIKVGDNIITKKGNSLYILKTIKTSLEDLDAETKEYLDTITREYGLKKVNITSVDNIIRFETWCQYVKPIISSFKSNMVTKNSIKNFSERLKSMFMPEEVKNVRLTTDGNICVKTNQGFVSIDKDNNLTSYPEEFTLDVPVFIISKPKDQVEVGDTILLNKCYAKVTKIDDNKITVINYNGTGKVVHTIKDFIMNQTMVKVVVSLVNTLAGQFNPMMLMMMSDKKDSLLPLLMMQQNKDVMNPMMLMMMSDKFDSKDLIMMSMLNKNMFNFPFNLQEVKTSELQIEDKEK